MSVARHAVKSLERWLPTLTGEAMKKRGFGEFRILNEWEKVVGPQLARHSSPVKISFERGKTMDGTLHIQVTSAMALEFQHMQPQILDRIATYFGYRAVGRLVMLQTARIFQAPAANHYTPVILEENKDDARINSVISSCDDDMVRASLASLAQAMFSLKKKE